MPVDRRGHEIAPPAQLAVEDVHLARVDAQWCEVGDLERSLGELGQEAFGDIPEGVAAEPPALRRQRLHVGPDEHGLLLTDRRNRKARGRSSRRTEQDDAPAVPNRGNGHLDAVGVSCRLDHRGGVDRSDGIRRVRRDERRRAAGPCDVLLAARCGDEGRRSAALRSGDPLREQPDEPGAHDRERRSRRDLRLVGALAADHTQLRERRRLQRDGIRHAMHHLRRHRHHARVGSATDCHGVALAQTGHALAGREDPSRRRVSRPMRIADAGIGQPQVLRPFRTGAHHAGEDLDRHLAGRGERHLDGQQLGAARIGPHDGLPADQAHALARRARAVLQPPPRLALRVADHRVGVSELREPDIGLRVEEALDARAHRLHRAATLVPAATVLH